MSSDSQARILIVDDRRESARALRKAMLERGYLVTDVPSGEEALLELRRTSFDLLIANNRLPGMSGAELIRRGRGRYPGLKVIVITEQAIADAQDELGDQAVSGIFQKSHQIGDLIATIDAVVFGKQPDLAPEAALEEDGRELPEFNREIVASQISLLMQDVRPEAIAFVDNNGHVLLAEGSFDESLRFRDLALVLANGFTTTAGIAAYLGNGRSGALQYYAGRWHDLYALAAGLHFFLVLVFPGGSQKEMGPVLRFGRPAVERILEAVEGEVPARKTGPLTKRRTGPLEGIMMQQDMSLDGAEEGLEDEIDFDALADLREDGQEVQVLELYFDALDAGPDSLDDADSFWEDAAQDMSAQGSESLSIDEAIELGLVPKDLDE